MAATPSSSSTTSASAAERLQREYGNTVAAVEPGGAEPALYAVLRQRAAAAT